MYDPLKPEEEKPQTSEEKAEALLREANLCRVRGDANRARDLLDEAEKLAPESSAVLEARGDYFAEQGMFRKSTECFAKAMELSPGLVSLERKHADSVYAQHTGEWAINEAMAGGQYITPNGAALFSMFVPGLGQFLLGHIWRGVALFALVVLSWVIALLIPDGLSEIGQLFGKGGGGDFNAVVLLPLFLAIVCHLGAIFDAAHLAKRNKIDKIERPAPLIDKDFEI